VSWIGELRRLLRLMGREAPATEHPGGVSCHEAAEEIFEWLDGELGEERAVRVGEHLETCARCYPRLVFERSFREAVAHAVQDPAVPPAMARRIRESLEAEGFGSS
jgi:mycothiol system anti-sigma-R factor